MPAPFQPGDRVAGLFLTTTYGTCLGPGTVESVTQRTAEPPTWAVVVDLDHTYETRTYLVSNTGRSDYLAPLSDHPRLTGFEQVEKGARP